MIMGLNMHLYATANCIQAQGARGAGNLKWRPGPPTGPGRGSAGRSKMSRAPGANLSWRDPIAVCRTATTAHDQLTTSSREIRAARGAGQRPSSVAAAGVLRLRTTVGTAPVPRHARPRAVWPGPLLGTRRPGHGTRAALGSLGLPVFGVLTMHCLRQSRWLSLGPGPATERGIGQGCYTRAALPAAGGRAA